MNYRFNTAKPYPEIIFDDWLYLRMLERATRWYSWSDDERLLQFVGHLHDRTACEYGQKRNSPSPWLYKHCGLTWKQEVVHWQPGTLEMLYSVRKRKCV